MNLLLIKTNFLYNGMAILTFLTGGYPSAPSVPSTGNGQLDATISRIMLILFVTGIVSALAGFIMLGNMFIWPSRKDKAKDHAPWTVLGSIILFSAGGIVTFISGMQLL
jgi:hypothetical protein